MIEITATGGCGYVNVSWMVTGNIEVCRPVQYNVTLSSLITNVDSVVTSMTTYRFTGLPDDTQFTVTVTGIYAMGLASDSDSTSVKTKENCTYVRTVILYYSYHKYVHSWCIAIYTYIHTICVYHH